MTQSGPQPAGSDWLGLGGKTVVVLGFANRKSVAWHVAKRLAELDTRVVHVVRSDTRAAELRALVGAGAEVLTCDVERPAEIESLRSELAERHPRIDGLVHSIAFANYERGLQPFHATERADFLQAMDISCFSLVALANALRELFVPRASVVTLSISHTHMAAESYGYMGPVKAALDSAVAFLAKSFAAGAQVRFNAVKAGLLKTSASAGIPGYLDSYLYAEGATLRHRALATEEVADTVLFLLSERSSGINAQGVVVDAGMSVNFFDRDLVRRATRPEESA
jgi:enoyl-[acyl-carrier protein] reductase I